MQKEFGKHIGGSRKELWSEDGNLSLETIRGMSPEEQKKYITREAIWAKPSYEKILAENPSATKEGVFALKEIYQALPSVIPAKGKGDAYADFVDGIRKMAEKMPLNFTSQQDYYGYWKPFFISRGLLDSGTDCITDPNHLFNARLWTATLYPSVETFEQRMQSEQFLTPKDEKIPRGYTLSFYSQSQYDFDQQIGRKFGAEPGTYFVRFGYDVIGRGFATRKEAAACCQKHQQEQKESKIAIKEPPLTCIQRTGLPDVRNGKEITGQDLVDQFSLYGVEVGNYVENQNMQTQIGQLYDALCDLGAILMIPKKDIGLDSRLSIALGARGLGGSSAAAHYEPLKQVINLTKAHGPGSLGHEYMHAIDDLVGKKLGLSFLSEHTSDLRALPSMQKVMKIIKTRTFTEEEKSVALERQKKNRTRVIENYKDSIRLTAERTFSEKGLTKEQVSKRDAAIRRFLDDPNETAESLSEEFRKLHGRGLRKPVLEDIASQKRILLWHQKSPLPELRDPESWFLQDARELDRIQSKSGKAYWQTDCELFARAGAAFLSDRLKMAGARDDYLSGHADSIAVHVPYLCNKQEQKTVYGAPQGQERADINQAFSELFRDLRIRGLLIQNPEQHVVAGRVEDKEFLVQQSVKNPSIVYYRIGKGRVGQIHVRAGLKNVAEVVPAILAKENLSPGYTLYNSDAEVLRKYPERENQVQMLRKILESGHQEVYQKKPNIAQKKKMAQGR